MLSFIYIYIKRNCNRILSSIWEEFNLGQNTVHAGRQNEKIKLEIALGRVSLNELFMTKNFSTYHLYA